WDEVVYQGHAIEQAGASILSTGIGWHEARVPTIVTSVPRAAFAFAAERLRREVKIPVVASNRINKPEVAEDLLARGVCDLVSMARPLLADPAFVNKAREGREDEINTCIACNQACLDHTFTLSRATCLVNPRACYETELVARPAQKPKRLAVVGAGPAGLAFAVEAKQRGHQVTLFEQSAEIGGQFNMARRIPGKEEFSETLRYFKQQLTRLGVDVRLSTRASSEMLIDGDYDDVVLATGVVPRKPEFEGADHPKVLSYVDVLLRGAQVGRRVAIIGAGGIGFDVAEFLACTESSTLDPARWLREWGVDPEVRTPGGVENVERELAPPAREIFLLQRKNEPLGMRLGKTSGWVHRATLKDKNVQMLRGVSYERVDDTGLTIRRPDGAPRLLEVDHVVLCAGQEPLRELEEALLREHIPVHRIGGADVAAELDAKRAIRQATLLALSL
ncbi:MAG TPA: FAD-dependent oxidoreductase, partial [Polyangiaceae bacterium]|nr:FAD-dependent oxidoreductase [Polyangiaceae bacterium]